MFDAPKSPYLVPSDGSFDFDAAPTTPPDGTPGKKKLKEQLAESTERLADLQRILYAHDRHSLLLIFQALDAAGKDSTIRHVFSGVDPAGFQVSSFKQPSAEELDHDFLWRSARRLPERGRIGIFNRSYYEEVLVVRVHPEYLDNQKLHLALDDADDLDQLWRHRFESIRDHEKHLTRNGTVVVKFFLHVSLDEQKRRFLSRLDEPHKHWKFSAGDVRERGFRDAYMHAYAEMLNATSSMAAPWYAIPADDKPFMRATVADLVVRTLESLDLHYPEVDPNEKARFDEMRAILDDEPT
ncbi:MAG: polyphosphate kinase 2 family protein [Acidobacteriota bacterium]